MRPSLVLTVSCILLAACVAAPLGQPSASSSAPSAAAAGAPTLTVDPLTAAVGVVGQPVILVAHATDAAGVARIELRANGVVVHTVSAPNPAGVPQLDVQLSWTPITAGSVALTVTAYRADGTASAPVALALAVVDAGTSVVTSPAATPGTPGETSAPPVLTFEPVPETAGPARTERPRPSRTPTAPPAQLADLVIDAIVVTPATPTTLKVDVYLTNYGTAAAGPFKVSLGYSGNNGVGTLAASDVNGLPANASTMVTQTSGELLPGAYTISAAVDYLDEVPESNEDNNTDDEPTAVEAPPVLLPDLQLTALSFPQVMTVGQEATGAFYVKNVGAADITSPFSAGFGYSGPNGGGAGSKLIESLAAGEQRFVSVAITPNAAGQYTITISADGSEEITESDEANNEASYTVSAQ